MDRFKVGDIAIYKQGGCSVEVEVIENLCDAERAAYTLKVLSLLSAVDRYPNAKLGATFPCKEELFAPPEKAWTLTRYDRLSLSPAFIEDVIGGNENEEEAIHPFTNTECGVTFVESNKKW